jgi:rubrerythrin
MIFVCFAVVIYSLKPTDMSNKTELIVRWDALLGKIQARFDETLQQAETGIDQFIDQLQYDTIALINVFTGLKNQAVFQLQKKAEEGWEKMDQLMDELDDLSSEERLRENKKMDNLNFQLEREFHVYETKQKAKAANKILQKIKAHIDENKIHNCTQCGYLLDVQVFSFMAKNVKCKSCGSVNTYEPDDRIRMMETWVILPLAEEYALDAWLKCNDAEKQIKDEDFQIMYVERPLTDLIRPMPQELLLQRNNAKADYYRSYYGYLMENVTDKKEYFQRQMEERIKWAEEGK